MRRRVRIIERLSGDSESQAIVKAYLATDPVAFFADFVWTYDPRNVSGGLPMHLPMLLWPKQRELLDWIWARYQGRESGLVKKGRDVGASWIFVGVATWLWLFRPNTKVTFGSRKLDYVDNLGEPDSIFGKIREVIDHLPHWMLPAGYDRRKHDKECLIRNPENGATIKGEGGDQMGRGGRSSMYVIDEFAFVERAERVNAAVRDNSDCVFKVSTSNGIGTQFHRDELAGVIPVFRLNYRDDPRKQPWEAFRAKAIAETDPVTFAREHEMDDASAVDRVVIPGEWVQFAVGYELPQNSTRQAGLDVATSGSAETVYVYRCGPVVTRVDAWRGLDSSASASRSSMLIRGDGGGHLAFDNIGVGAGVEGDLARSTRELLNGQTLGFTYGGVNGGSSPSATLYDDAPTVPAGDRFLNLRAELWWSLRLRFKKTFEHRTGVRHWPLDEQISIPPDAILIAQLSSVTWQPVASGKLKIRSKDEMRKDGIASPDRADALTYAFADVARPQAWWV